MSGTAGRCLGAGSPSPVPHSFSPIYSQDRTTRRQLEEHHRRTRGGRRSFRSETHAFSRAAQLEDAPVAADCRSPTSFGENLHRVQANAACRARAHLESFREEAESPCERSSRVENELRKGNATPSHSPASSRVDGVAVTCAQLESSRSRDAGVGENRGRYQRHLSDHSFVAAANCEYCPIPKCSKSGVKLHRRRIHGSMRALGRGRSLPVSQPANATAGSLPQLDPTCGRGPMALFVYGWACERGGSGYPIVSAQCCGARLAYARAHTARRRSTKSTGHPSWMRSCHSFPFLEDEPCINSTSGAARNRRLTLSCAEVGAAYKEPRTGNTRLTKSQSRSSERNVTPFADWKPIFPQSAARSAAAVAQRDEIRRKDSAWRHRDIEKAGNDPWPSSKSSSKADSDRTVRLRPRILGQCRVWRPHQTRSQVRGCEFAITCVSRTENAALETSRNAVVGH